METKHTLYQFFGNKNPKNMISSKEIYKYWIQKSIDDSSNGGNCENYLEQLNSYFNTLRRNIIPIYDAEIANANNRNENDEKQLDDLTNNKDKKISASRRMRRASDFKQKSALELEKSNIERESRRVKAKRFTNEQNLEVVRSLNSAPIIEIPKSVFWGISGAYVLAASFFNFPIFQEVFGDMPIGGFIAPVAGLIEGYMAHLIGQALSTNNQKVAYTVGSVSVLILIFLIGGQIFLTDHSVIGSAFIVLLFIIATVTSYIYFSSHFQRVVDQLKKEEDALSSEYQAKSNEIKTLEITQQDEPENQFDINIEKLNDSISESDFKKQELAREKEDETQQLDTLEERIKVKARSIFEMMTEY